ncbi:hypothetical protein D3C77_319310 [compost metagenome]
MALFGRARTVERQFEQGLLARQLGNPVIQLPLTLAGFHPLTLPQGVIRVLNRQRWQLQLPPLSERGIRLHQLLDHHLHRPAIADAVVLGEHQHMLIGGQAQQAHTQQRAVGQVEQAAGFGFYQGGQLCSVGRGGRQVFDLQAQIANACDVLQGLLTVVNEGGAQRFVALDQRPETVLQGVEVQRAAQAQGGRDVIGRAVRVELPEEPLALLGIGQL